MQKSIRTLSPFNNELKLKGFKVFPIEGDSGATRQYSRKDFYKICLSNGRSKIHYANRSYEVEGSILFFGNPHIPYAWETLSQSYTGYTCLFSEEFLRPSMQAESLLQSPLFKIEGTPIFQINEEQRLFLSRIFDKMIAEQAESYSYKDELIRNYIQLIVHEALKLEPSKNFDRQSNALARLTTVFLELLERQFPIEGVESPLVLKKPQDYAQALSVHVNYLNRAVKEVTQKSTSTHIKERILLEAKALLEHTNWNISELAYALGFSYPSYFNNYFKKELGLTPSAYRQSRV
ncbi:helix-turn-helix domain-containing protein [Saprospira sp. CCB-QB6]|nr:helix-turn-helix domain-containing protein [Saprospira sp. CCB-QB6]WCL80228.1 helix-turn-helix domain-containing protein [Saprospira sp. CCB-QB6]